MIPNQPEWSEEYRIAGLDWADKEAAAQMLEDSKSAVLAQKCAELGDIPVNRAEQTVKASSFWAEYIKKAVAARQEANVARVEMEYRRMRFNQRQSQEANARAEMRTLGTIT